MSRRLRRAAWFLALALAGCGAHRPDLDERVDRATAGRQEDPEIAAAEARVLAARSAVRASGSIVPEAELRVRNITANNVSQGEDVAIGVRVPLERPFTVRAERRAEEHALEAEVAELELDSVSRMALLCTRSIDAYTLRDARPIVAAYVALLEQIRQWNEAWRAAGTVDELNGAELALLVQRRLVELSPLPPHSPDLGRDHLPEVTAPARPLRREPRDVRALVLRSHPLPAQHAAEAQRYRALAAEERRQALPWLEFVEVSYVAGGNARDVETQLAVSFPIDPRNRARAREMDALGQSERLSREAAADELTRDALIALELIAQFEANGARWAELLTAADSGETEVRRFVDARIGAPDDAAELLDEVFQSRMAALEARQRAGTAACDLLHATGVRLADWPRD